MPKLLLGWQTLWGKQRVFAAPSTAETWLAAITVINYQHGTRDPDPVKAEVHWYGSKIRVVSVPFVS